MLHPAPRWTFTSRPGLTQLYGHVQFLPDKVLGQWWCVDREAGTVLWQRKLGRPNTVIGVAEDVIVASELRSNGPWTLHFGCYGLSLKTGERLWTSHAEGWGGRVLRLADAIPGFTNEYRDTARFVIGSECVCESGRVLDVRTGRLLRRLPRQELKRLLAEEHEQLDIPATRGEPPHGEGDLRARVHRLCDG